MDKEITFVPTDEMRQVNGVWRYKPGVKDEYGKLRGGHYVKGAPSPNSTGRTKLDAVVVDFIKNISIDAAELLYDTMMDKSEPTKLRVKCAEHILNRALGRAHQSIKIENDNIEDFIRPIIITQEAIENDDD